MSPGDTAARFKHPCISAEPRADMAQIWRSGDYTSGKPWSPCAGDTGTKAQTMGDLMGRRIRKLDLKGARPVSAARLLLVSEYTHIERAEQHGQKHMYT